MNDQGKGKEKGGRKGKGGGIRGSGKEKRVGGEGEGGKGLWGGEEEKSELCQEEIKRIREG